VDKKGSRLHPCFANVKSLESLRIAEESLERRRESLGANGRILRCLRFFLFHDETSGLVQTGREQKRTKVTKQLIVKDIASMFRNCEIFGIFEVSRGIFGA
jgi:hypothetical protein